MAESSNLNHHKQIYPRAAVADISWKDILMVMDCDHMVVQNYFHKCCATMLDTNTAVCLAPVVPQPQQTGLL
jgi:chorismate mutase